MPEARTSKRAWVVAVVAAVVVALAVACFVLYARGGGPVPEWLEFLGAAQDPLEASGPAETVLRTVRLAGFQRASVGDAAGTAVLRIEMPRIDTAADVEVAWQTGVGALAVAYPGASDYVVQLFEGDRGLVEVAWVGEKARAAVDADDAAALQRDAEFTFLTTEATGE